MEAIRPLITVQNTDSQYWLVSADGLIGEGGGKESISFTVHVKKSTASLEDLTRKAAERAIQLLQMYLDNGIQD